jgi:hypothetical protein
MIAITSPQYHPVPNELCAISQSSEMLSIIHVQNVVKLTSVKPQNVVLLKQINVTVREHFLLQLTPYFLV